MMSSATSSHLRLGPEIFQQVRNKMFSGKFGEGGFSGAGQNCVG